MSVASVLTYFQVLVGLVLGPILLLLYYREFCRPLYRFVTTYLGLALILVLLYLLVYAVVGNDLGLPPLFWHEDAISRVAASTGATLLLALIGVIAFYLDMYPLETGEKTRTWLGSDDEMRRRCIVWWSGTILCRWLPGVRGTAPPQAASNAPQPGIHDRARFFINSLFFDWLAFLPFQIWVEPKYADVKRLRRFLRACRTPFLLMLMAPAWLPGLFVMVPRGTPTSWPGWESLWEIRDVSRDPVGWLIGVVTWQAGILLGVAIVKVALRVSEWLWVLFVGEEGLAEIDQPFAQRPQDWQCLEAACPAPGCTNGPFQQVVERPPQCKGWYELRKSIAVFFALVLLLYLAMGNIPWVYNRWVSPAFAICAALGILAMIYSLIALQRRVWQLPMVLALMVYFGFANHDPFKNRFENLCYDARRLVPLRERVDAAYFNGKFSTASDPELVADRLARDHWYEATKSGDAKPKLVLVAVSGGAARSAYWTATVLERLEAEIPGFGQHVRIISGASGGMLGAACYVVHRRDTDLGKEKERKTSWVDSVPTDSLKPLAKYIALSEIWQSCYPSRLIEDRGVVLERDWMALRFPLRKLTKLEEEGKVPSLIFSPMIVEDGRRLLISNLDLGRSDDGSVPPMVKSRGGIVSDQLAGEKVGNYSLSALEFYRIFPEAMCLYLSTAVRMSATFPYVSPAVNLPCEPPRRVVDAGYYDNYGVEVATAWIYHNQKWLADHTSGVLLVQIRDSVSVKERLDVDDDPPGWAEWLGRGFQFLTSPIDGFSAARVSSSSFRNDQDVETLSDLFTGLMAGKVKDPARFFTTVIFENSASVTLTPEPAWPDVDAPPTGDGAADVAMTWYLTRREIAGIKSAIPHGTPPSSLADEAKRRKAINDLHEQVFKTLPPGTHRDVRFKQLEHLRNYERLQKLKQWWCEAGVP